MQASRGFCWHELRASDPAAAARFYGDLFGWAVVEARTGFEFWLDGSPVGGASQVTPGVPPHWSPFVAVGDLAIAAHEFTKHGGEVVAGPMPSARPEGSLAVATHPTAGGLVLFADATDALSTDVGSAVGIGRFGWHQLDTPDLAAATAFYQEYAGWSQIPPGTGTASVVVLQDSSERDIATVTAGPSEVPAAWMSLVRVDDLSEIARRTTELGALVVTTEAEVPPVGRCAVLRDHDGVTFACYQL